MTHAVVVTETCCQHYCGVYGVGTQEEMQQLADTIGQDLIEGYRASVAKIENFGPSDYLSKQNDYLTQILKETA